MQRTAVIEQLRTHIAQNVLEGKDVGLDETTPLLEWGIINSLEVVRLLDFMSRQFTVDITPDKLSADHFTNISAIADLVMGNMPREE
jgi:acyl carrier protein